MELRDYQKQIATEGVEILKKHKILILAMQVRTGKTITALEVARQYGARKVLFVTKKKAIRSIESDWELFDPGFELTVINYESLHRIKNKGFDLVIADESHCCFIPGTMVGGTPIEKLKRGDMVESYNERTHGIERRKVLNVFKNEITEDLIKIKANGKEVICTRSHQIYTKRGWVDAGSIRIGDEVLMV